MIITFFSPFVNALYFVWLYFSGTFFFFLLRTVLVVQSSPLTVVKVCGKSMYCNMKHFIINSTHCILSWWRKIAIYCVERNTWPFLHFKLHEGWLCQRPSLYICFGMQEVLTVLFICSSAIGILNGILSQVNHHL